MESIVEYGNGQVVGRIEQLTTKTCVATDTPIVVDRIAESLEARLERLEAKIENLEQQIKDMQAVDQLIEDSGDAIVFVPADFL